MRAKMFVLSSVLILALALSACGAADDAEPTLFVVGSGTVYVPPDVAYVYIGVHTEEADVAQAVASNNAQAQAVVNALRNSGVEAKDIQTSNFSVWSYQKTDPITGENLGTVYSVDNTVFVTVRDLTKLGQLLDVALNAGANNINGITFDLADKSAALAEARAKAMENAAALAGELAGSAGVTLGDIQNISYTETPMPYAAYGYGGGGGGAEGGVVAPINPGQITVTATVSVTYEIK